MTDFLQKLSKALVSEVPTRWEITISSEASGDFTKVFVSNNPENEEIPEELKVLFEKAVNFGTLKKFRRQGLLTTRDTFSRRYITWDLDKLEEALGLDE